MRVDLHQHVWTPPLLGALQARERLPFVRHSDGVATLHSAGERPYAIDVASESASARVALLRADGVDRAVVALSSPIGIELLERDAAVPLISAHLDGVLALGPQFAAWGPVPLDSPDPADVDAVLARGCIGVSLPAGALAGHRALERLRPLLARVQARGVPLFVHPGAPARGVETPPEAPGIEPSWWRALTDYVAQMQTAWVTFATAGRPSFPRLAVVYAMLAGGGPLLAERLAMRGGPQLDLADPLTAYDTSGSGPQLVAAVQRLVGRERLVYGSDRPVVEPSPTAGDRELMLNAGRLLREAV